MGKDGGGKRAKRGERKIEVGREREDEMGGLKGWGGR